MEMVGAALRINNMDRFVTAFETVFDKRKRHAVLVFWAFENRSDMTCFAELGAGKRNGCADLRHVVILRSVMSNQHM